MLVLYIQIVKMPNMNACYISFIPSLEVKEQFGRTWNLLSYSTTSRCSPSAKTYLLSKVCFFSFELEFC